MKTILHILTREDELARTVIEKQRQLAETRVDTVELPPQGADYKELVAKIFAADSVEVW